MHQLGAREVARPCGLSRFPRVRRVIDLTTGLLSVAHIENVWPAFKLACRWPRIPQQRLD
jgi:hypothetical protein